MGSMPQEQEGKLVLQLEVYGGAVVLAPPEISPPFTLTRDIHDKADEATIDGAVDEDSALMGEIREEALKVLGWGKQELLVPRRQSPGIVLEVRRESFEPEEE
ncbi:hypothetical protein E2562_019643 [Oryza meyeriana var. granulata]|uniref:Uncharacterized protein n=1 Tax=Oryza meyeriana var. granulata TaxID=110450 RepID=A0A6G1C7D9_9ORYZ|nr:hypothetical protein E2562_019643 [Oryza meyeriana var. granulata]